MSRKARNKRRARQNRARRFKLKVIFKWAMTILPRIDLVLSILSFKMIEDPSVGYNKDKDQQN